MFIITMNNTTDSLPTYEQVVYEDSKIQLEKDETSCKHSFLAFLIIILFCFFTFSLVFFIAPK
jgi:hypothetical protein